MENEIIDAIEDFFYMGRINQENITIPRTQSSLKKEPLNAILKYPGGKRSELQKIDPTLFPQNINNYIDPFVGGGGAFFSFEANHYFINDKSTDLISIYRSIKTQNNDFFDFLSALNGIWVSINSIDQQLLIETYKTQSEKTILKQIININNQFENVSLFGFKKIFDDLFNKKIQRISKNETQKGSMDENQIASQIETLCKMIVYTFLRNAYNQPIKKDYRNSAIFYFLREFCYTGMFRNNSKNEFNVAYGGESYNRKNIIDRFNYWQSKNYIEHLNKTTIYNEDFEPFLNQLSNNLNKDDLVFLDPPYDETFSKYDKSNFIKNDHTRLQETVKNLNAKFILIIKNTKFIKDLYKEFNIQEFNKKYIINMNGRNDKNVNHLIIRNYE